MPQDQADTPMSTPAGQSSSSILGPLVAYLAVSAVTLVALGLYRIR